MTENWIDLVADFHRKFGVPVSDTLTRSTALRRELRRSLIAEEATETSVAFMIGDMEKIADGLADTIYVCIGAALELGIPLDAVFREVHRANMRKAGGATREDGKILKPEGWVPPDIASILGTSMGTK